MHLFKKITACLFAFCVIISASAQTAGKVIEQNSIESNILHKNVGYSVYLPPDYFTSERSYSVVYLLHGYTDDNTGWVQFGEINRYADKAIAEGAIPPMIIIMLNGDSSWYINSYDGKENYEDFFIKEFIPTVEKKFRIKSERRYRGIAGLSMGGYGTLFYAIKYPQLFAACPPLSAAVFDDEAMVNMPDPNYEQTFGQLYGRGLKEKRVSIMPGIAIRF